MLRHPCLHPAPACSGVHQFAGKPVLQALHLGLAYHVCTQAGPSARW